MNFKKCRMNFKKIMRKKLNKYYKKVCLVVKLPQYPVFCKYSAHRGSSCWPGTKQQVGVLVYWIYLSLCVRLNKLIIVSGLLD